MSPTGSRPATPRKLSNAHSQHNPSTPSRLKHSHAPGSSPEQPSPTFETPASRFPSHRRTDSSEDSVNNPPSTPSPLRPRHWRNYSTHNCSQPEGEPCEHGAFSPMIRPTSPPTSVTSTLDDASDHGFGGRYARGQSIAGGVNGVLGDAVGDTVFGDGNIFGGGGEDGKHVGRAESWRRWWAGGDGDGKGGTGNRIMSTTRWLATKHGIKNKRRMYVSIPTRTISPFTSEPPICTFQSSSLIELGTWSTTFPSSNGLPSTVGPSSKAMPSPL